MKKFNELISEQKDILSKPFRDFLDKRLAEADTPAIPNPNENPIQSKLPPSPLTPEGKVFLIDLARKALAFDPNQLPEFDKEILGTSVNAENADKVLKNIQRIIGTN